jgi:ribosomal-protein-alanine N-acetyltransferase
MLLKKLPKIHVTDRVVFVPPTWADFPEVYQILSNLKVMQYVTTGARTKSEAKAELISWIEHREKHGFGPYLARCKREGNLIGFAKLYLSDRAQSVQVGYCVQEHLWGLGLGTEIAQGCLELGLEYLQEEELVAFARIENKASRHILEKIGMGCETDNFQQENRVYARYSIDAAKYFSIQGLRQAS